MRNESTANHHMHNAAQQRDHIVQVLGSSKVVQRQRYQRKAVARKQHNGLLFCVMLAASALIGALLAS